MSDQSGFERAQAYVDRVLSGKRLAGKFEILHCKRFRADLERQFDPDWPYKLDLEKFEKIIKFCELLPHTKGRWASAKKEEDRLLKAEGWQCFWLGNEFGWVEKETRLRRFLRSYKRVPRKNGKSDIEARKGLYMFCADDEYGAEVYSGATSERQAWEVFRPARLMAERSEKLRERYGIEVNAKKLVIPDDGSRFEPVVRDPGDGASPSCSITDEYHEHDSDALVDTMETGMGARDQPMSSIITTAGSDLGGPCYQEDQDAQKVLEGVREDDRLFVMIFAADDEDDWTADEALQKANPNLGVSVSKSYLQQQRQKAIASPRKQASFKTKHLNLWVNAASPWMDMLQWMPLGDEELDWDDFQGEECWIGIDLASKLDLTAVQFVWRRFIDGRPHFYTKGRYYLPEETTNKPEPIYERYRGWADAGDLIATEGNVIDYGRILEDLERDIHRYNIQQVRYDPHGATQLVQTLQDDKLLEVMEVPQRAAHLSEPMKELEALVIDKRLHHDGNDVMNWMMSNVVAKQFADETIFPRKERAENKIDGPVALIIALGGVITPGGENSYLADGELLFV